MEKPICTVDVVLLTIHKSALHVALFKRPNAPFAGAYALPGGYVHTDSDASCFDSAMRVLSAKTKVQTPYLEQLATFSGAHRDPRGWSLTVVYYALVREEVLVAANPEDMQLVPVDDIKNMPFDHAQLIASAVDRLRRKAEYSSLPVHLCPEEFTLPELQAVYESVQGVELHKSTFLRKIRDLNVVEQVKEEVGGQLVTKMRRGAGRSAEVYRLKPALQYKVVNMARAFNS